MNCAGTGCKGSSSHAAGLQAADADSSTRKHEEPVKPAMEAPEEIQIFFDEEYHAQSPIVHERQLESAFSGIQAVLSQQIRATRSETIAP